MTLLIRHRARLKHFEAWGYLPGGDPYFPPTHDTHNKPLTHHRFEVNSMNMIIDRTIHSLNPKKENCAITYTVDYNKPIMYIYKDFNLFKSKNEIARDLPLLLTNPNIEEKKRSDMPTVQVQHLQGRKHLN